MNPIIADSGIDVDAARSFVTYAQRYGRPAPALSGMKDASSPTEKLRMAHAAELRCLKRVKYLS